MMGHRRVAVIALTFLMAMCIIARLTWVQGVHRGWYLDRVLEQRVHSIEVPVRRGDITDRNGRILATSLMKTTIFVDPRDADAGQAAAVLAPLLGRSEAELRAAIGANPTYVEIARGVDAAVAAAVSGAIAKHELKGVGFFQEPVRYYPMGSLAAHLVGFVGEQADRPRDVVGLGGVELSYDSYLHGQNGWVVAERDALQQEIPGAARLEVRGTPGDNVQLTLDLRMQRVVEEELKKQIEATQSKRGAVIVMNPHNGEILAMASLPSFDPGALDEADPDNLFNFPLSGVYEPGSSFKALTAAIAYEEGLIQEGELFDCADSVTIRDENAEAVIRDWQPGGFGMQTVEGVLGYSCNVGTVAIGMRITPEMRRSYMERLGIINPDSTGATGVDLPGEGKELIQDEPAFSTNISQATMSIGQGFAVTPLQMLTAFATIANNGYRVQPHVVRQITAADGTVRYTYPARVRDRIFSAETTALVKRGIQYVVEKGTATLAQVPGYTVGGKTGTAEKVTADQTESGYAKGKYYAAFAGVAPVGNPAFVMLVVLDEPQTHSGYGGMNAAPLFSQIARRILPMLGVEPDDKEVVAWSTAAAPDVTGLLVTQAEAALAPYQDSLSYVVTGTGEWIRSQEILEHDGKPLLQLTAAPLAGSDGYWRVPDLGGMDQAAVTALLGEGLALMFYGEGQVVGQSVPAGTRVPAGSALVLWLEKGSTAAQDPPAAKTPGDDGESAPAESSALTGRANGSGDAAHPARITIQPLP